MKAGKRRGRSKKKTGILRTLLLLAVSLILGLNIYLWNARSLVGNALPMPFGYGVSVVLSGSMEPALSVDDLVFLKETQNVEEGDVIVYQSGRELIIHRVVMINGETLQTKGDANPVPDTPINISDVKGKMTGKVPFAGKIVRALKTPAGVAAVAIAAFALTELSYRKEREEDVEDMERIKAEIRRLKEEQKDRNRNG